MILSGNNVRINPCLLTIILFVSLGVFSSHSIIFHLYGEITITGEGVQLFNYTWYSWPWSSGGSLGCYTYCDTEYPFIWLSPRILDTCSRALSSETVTICFTSLGMIRTTNVPHAQLLPTPPLSQFDMLTSSHN